MWLYIPDSVLPWRQPPNEAPGVPVQRPKCPNGVLPQEVGVGCTQEAASYTPLRPPQTRASCPVPASFPRDF